MIIRRNVEKDCSDGNAKSGSHSSGSISESNLAKSRVRQSGGQMHSNRSRNTFERRALFCEHALDCLALGNNIVNARDLLAGAG